jgi:hypothetical protein
MGKKYGISPEELAWRRRQPAAVNGSVFDRKNKRVEPELTRAEMDKLAQTRVDALKVSGRLPSPDQVIRDVEDLIAEVHPGELRSMYMLNDRGLFHDGRRVPRMLHYQEAPDGTHQYVIDILCHWFRDDIDPERRALAIYRKSPDLLFTRFSHSESGCISDAELEEMMITLLCRCHDERETFVEYLGGTRRDTLRLQ